jgi:hypothetical protein
MSRFPRAPWGSFPLSELVVALALGCAAAGAIGWGSVRGTWFMGAALALGSLAGAEIALREHLAGRRDRSALLATAAAAVTSTVALLAGSSLSAAMVVALVTATGVFVAMRRVRRRGRS